ncbi:NeuD/PglB/VioB family sugar acetyltransferase [Sneathiella limimaris]|uniref:NeuD/PglB/VioB family sugar acetyltransferase n=1 Tax=Sneathiella limimaris TaxID=1964213 RepID=UPI00146B1137|nr:NeuD/PglB/VioB family sugar acetyltransferase [Sneathiella limimaris]
MSIILIGGGAQAKYAAETFHQLGKKVSAVINLRNGQEPLEWCHSYGLKAYPLKDLSQVILETETTKALLCTASASEKKSLEKLIQETGLALTSAIHPKASIASTAHVDVGCIINAGAVIQPFARIEKNTMIHANAIVEHDCHIGAFCNLAPGCKLAGWVTLETGVTVFTGASIIPGKTIGAGSIIGAGAVVIDDIPVNSKVVGVPGKPSPTNPKELQN